MWSSPTEQRTLRPTLACRSLTAHRSSLITAWLRVFVLTEIEPDYLFAFTSIRRACDAVRSQSERELTIEQQAKDEAEQTNAERLQSCQHIRDSVANMKSRQVDMQDECSNVNERMVKLQQDIAGETVGETHSHTQTCLVRHVIRIAIQRAASLLR